ncbi:MAG: hypothetical protein K8823_1096 [Cenarchaeum symbiont of Oopsacas minuta]|nr:hypothetical protein [Cenarchaeum symbiont of Oopsacas minuta]
MIFIIIYDFNNMQYFSALRAGQKRVAIAREYLNGVCGGNAMPALALANDTKDGWTPVGEEMLYAAIDESSGFVLTDTSGYIISIVDSAGISKALIQGVTQKQKENMVNTFESDGICKYDGKVTLPV